MYEEKYVKRGEIYSVRLDNGMGNETTVTRPGLIISNDVGNNTSPTVVVAYLTTRDHNIGIHYGPTKATGRPSFVQCEQLATVDKRRLGYLMGQLTRDEMKQVEDRLDEALDMGFIDDAPLKEKEAECAALRIQKDNLEAEIFRLKKKIEAHDDELLAKDVEIAVAKRMYEKAVGIIAAMKAEPDLPERPNGPPKPSKPEEPPKKPDKPKAEPKLVDINTATFSVLRGVGFTNNIVLGIINGRPYKSVEDIKKVSGINNRLYGIASKKLCCIPVEAEPDSVSEVEAAVAKVNMNTATVDEMVAAGINKTNAQLIRAYRNKNGAFGSLEDLLKVSRCGTIWLERHRDKMEV